MRFPMPNFPCHFELPDDWLAESGMDAFTPTATAYRSTAEAVLVPIHEIEPPYRVKTCLNDWRGFDRTRMIRVINRIATEAEIEAIPLVPLPELEFSLSADAVSLPHVLLPPMRWVSPFLCIGRRRI